MSIGERVLVVDDSQFMHEILGQSLRPHFLTMLFASSYTDAVRQLNQNPNIDTVICDVILPDGNGFQILEQIMDGPEPRPKVLLITARYSEFDRERAVSLGAIGYLPKPISVADIRARLTAPAGVRDTRHRTLAKAWLVDPVRRERLLAFDIHDISSSGALLDTAGPFPIGVELEFEIALAGEGDAIRAKGTIVRTQEPSWLGSGGSGVRFDWIESQRRLNQLIRGNPGATAA